MDVFGAYTDERWQSRTPTINLNLKSKSNLHVLGHGQRIALLLLLLHA